MARSRWHGATEARQFVAHETALAEKIEPGGHARRLQFVQIGAAQVPNRK